MFGDDLLAQVVRSHVGSSARLWKRDPGDLTNPLDIVLNVAAYHLTRPFALFCVDGGLPESVKARLRT